MKILLDLEITNTSDIIYAKNSIKNRLKLLNSSDKSYFIFSLMELATNIIKHAQEGKIYLLESHNEFILAALDYGNGIKNIQWALQNGTSIKNNSLGLGLYQMNRDTTYHVEIFSLSQTNMHGSIVLVKPRTLNPNIISLQLLYPTETLCGDLFIKKGKYLLLADASGHGKKANITAEVIKKYFYSTPFSCLDINYFFENLHTYLKSKQLRGAAISVFQLSQNLINVCGIGNITFWKSSSNKFSFTTQKDGIIGEYFSSAHIQEFLLEENDTLLATTDGLDTNKMCTLLTQYSNNLSSIMLALMTMHFASVKYDDKTILIIRRNPK